MKFEELCDKAKERVRQKYCADISGDWWDPVYEDAINMGKVLGITIAGKTDIEFTGFWSQGDGAVFNGSYSYNPDAVTDILQVAPEDAFLHRLARDLEQLAVEARLVHGTRVSATCLIDRGSRYRHSGCMSVSAYGREGTLVSGDVYMRLRELLRSFANWIYRQLEKEYEYLTSYEHLAEALHDMEFDAEGYEV